VGYEGVVYFFYFLFLPFVLAEGPGGLTERVRNIGVIGRGRMAVFIFLFLEWFDGVGIVGVDTTEGGF
jgi:hypothetical protein